MHFPVLSQCAYLISTLRMCPQSNVRAVADKGYRIVHAACVVCEWQSGRTAPSVTDDGLCAGATSFTSTVRAMSPASLFLRQLTRWSAAGGAGAWLGNMPNGTSWCECVGLYCLSRARATSR